MTWGTGQKSVDKVSLKMGRLNARKETVVVVPADEAERAGSARPGKEFIDLFYGLPGQKKPQDQKLSPRRLQSQRVWGTGIKG